MAVKDKIWLLAHSKHPEARRAWAVLYWKYQGLTHREVGQKLFKGKDWVQRYMTMIYKIFDAPKIEDKDEKYQWLVDNVYPALKEFLEQYPDTVKELPLPSLEEPELSKGPLIEIPVIDGEEVPPEPPPEPPTQPNRTIQIYVPHRHHRLTGVLLSLL